MMLPPRCEPSAWQIILVDLAKLPRHVCALYFLGTVASEGYSFKDVKTCRYEATARAQ